MAKVISQSIFTSNTSESRSWQSYITSGAIHTLLILALFLITFPTLRDMARPAEHVVIVAPVIPEYKPKVIPRPVVRPNLTPKVVQQPSVPPKPVVQPPVVKPPEIKQQMIVKAPEVKALPPAGPPLPAARLPAPAPPKPEVHTGVFNSERELAKADRVPNEVKVGGFGDPNGVKPALSQPSPVLMARVGGFDRPEGDGQTGGGGHHAVGSVRASGFDSPGDANGRPGGTGPRSSVKTGGFGDSAGVAGGTGVHAGSVRTGGFNDSTVAPLPTRPAQASVAAPPTTPVQVLFKPKPAYSAEARNLKLEGQVALEVVFGANGSVRVLHVIRGLGHGLDEAAQQAATQVKFRPATKDGAPVDTSATIYIMFELT